MKFKLNNRRPARLHNDESFFKTTPGRFPLHSSPHRFARRAAALIAAMAISAPALAQVNPPTWVGSGAPAVKPAASDSYIVTSNNLILWDGATNLPATATNLPAAMNAFPGPTVDVLMQQCFGGGFAQGMQAAINQYTFTAATNWNELALNTPVGSNNFTSSWVQSFPRSEGLYTHYLDATNGAPAAGGNPAVTADPYGPAGASRTAKYFEDPSYASPDPLVAGNPDPAGANNSRDVVATNQWAVLMAPSPLTNGVDTPRFGVNIDRVYDSLLTLIPANHIIVLYGSNAANTATAGGTPINGPGTLANIQNALQNGTGLYGNITGQTNPGNPNNTSHLFVYTTGHGESWTKLGGAAAAAPGNLTITVATKPANGFTDSAGTDSNLGTVDLEIAFPSHINSAGVTAIVDGNIVPLPIVDEGSLPLTDLSPIIGTPSLFYWDVPVPLSDLNAISPGAPDTIEFTGSGLTASSLVSAVTYNDYGDSWSVGIQSVPEPTTLALLATGLPAVFFFRKCRRCRPVLGS